MEPHPFKQLNPGHPYCIEGLTALQSGISCGRLEDDTIHAPKLADNVPGWMHDDGTLCPEHLAPADGRHWWCTTHQQRVSLPGTPAALADVAELRRELNRVLDYTGTDVLAALDRIEQALRAGGAA
jgi:hypothetical protein